MMKEAQMLGRYVMIQGFRKAKIENVDALLKIAREASSDCDVQFFDAGMIAGFDHLYFATLNALKAFEAKQNISKNLAVEALLFASGQHQIKRAVELLGLKHGSSEVIVLVIAEDRSKDLKTLERISKLLGGEACLDVIELTDEKAARIKAAFGITDLEIESTLRQSEKEALSMLLVERGALLVTQR